MTLPDFSRINPFTIGQYTFDGEYVSKCVTMTNGLDVEMVEVSAWIAFWGAMVSDAKQTHDVKDAAYRGARDGWKRTQLIERTPKPTKTALDDEWRTTDTYQQWHAQLSDSERAWNLAQYIYEALLRKSNQLSALSRIEHEQRIARANPAMPHGG